MQLSAFLELLKLWKMIFCSKKVRSGRFPKTSKTGCGRSPAKKSCQVSGDEADKELPVGSDEGQIEYPKKEIWRWYRSHRNGYQQQPFWMIMNMVTDPIFPYELDELVAGCQQQAFCYHPTTWNQWSLWDTTGLTLRPGKGLVMSYRFANSMFVCDQSGQYPKNMGEVEVSKHSHA